MTVRLGEFGIYQALMISPKEKALYWFVDPMLKPSTTVEIMPIATGLTLLDIAGGKSTIEVVVESS